MVKTSLKVAPKDTVIALRRVSTAEQEESGAGLAAQTATIEDWAARNGKTIVKWYTEQASGKTVDKRPKLQQALADVQNLKAEGIVVAKLDRLTRSLLDFASICEKAQRERWNLVAIDLGVDLSTPIGQLIGNFMAAFAQWERQMISVRTREGLAAKKAQGVRMGRPRLLPDEVILRIIAMRKQGLSTVKIARALNEDNVPQAQGGKQWFPATVGQVLRSQDGLALAGKKAKT